MFKPLSPPKWAKKVSDDAYRWVADLSDKFVLTSVYTVTIDPVSVAANSTSEQAFTVLGIKTTDIVVVNKPTHTPGIGIVNARASANDQVSITFINATASPVDAPSESYLITGVRS